MFLQRAWGARQTDLNVLFVLKQWCFHDILQGKAIWLNIEFVSRQVGDAVPVPQLHSLVGHHLQEGAGLTEVIDAFLQVQESLPVLKAFGQFATSARTHHGLTFSFWSTKDQQKLKNRVPVLELQKLSIDLLNVHISPKNVIIATDLTHDCIIQTIQLLKKT